ncbi:MAG: Pyrimidine-specific ribonucleoside hydrolase RihA [Anaerolineae bacterium]|nr:Pyrimidine-specific ribonucleoside hydrolase RihA [Anaerolineae bacterium]
MPESILIDTDPGIDDAMAILFALKAPELEVYALTTVYGNHFVEITTRNALRLLELASRDEIPVARGASAPLVREYTSPPTFVHGSDGLGDAGLTDEPDDEPAHARAAQFIVEAVMSHPGEITLVPLGPLTNIAMALKLEPRLVKATKRVVLMGGAAFAPGNVSPVAEANIYNDPEAAAVVFGAGWDVTMVGLDVTTRIDMSRAYIDALAATRAPYAELVARMAPHYQTFHARAYQNDGALHTHDPAVIAYLIQPALFQTASYRVRVDTSGVCTGKIVVDREGKWYDGVATNICVGVDEAGVLELFRERITRP